MGVGLSCRHLPPDPPQRVLPEGSEPAVGTNSWWLGGQAGTWGCAGAIGAHREHPLGQHIQAARSSWIFHTLPSVPFQGFPSRRWDSCLFPEPSLFSPSRQNSHVQRLCSW